MAHIKWIKSQLTGRSQISIVNQKSSSAYKFPQGMVVFPTLFNIFINDLKENIKSLLIMLAVLTNIMEQLIKGIGH